MPDSTPEDHEAVEEAVKPKKRKPLDWDPILITAAEIVESYNTGVTLRQLFYRLVSLQLIPNTQSYYKTLSAFTARARRAGSFPDLVDNTRAIQRPWYAPSAKAAVQSTIRDFRLERTRDQPYSIYVGVEKNALGMQLYSWYKQRGIPVIAFGGYPSQTFVDNIRDDIERQERPAVLIYGGDFDPTGVDILRDFKARTAGLWHEVDRIALNFEQIEEYNLPPLPGKPWDPRAAGFALEHGRVMQVELDALPPDVLKKLFDAGVSKWWKKKPYEAVLEEEAIEKKKIILPAQTKRLIQEMKYVRDINDEELIVSEDFDELLDKYLEIFSDEPDDEDEDDDE